MEGDCFELVCMGGGEEREERAMASASAGKEASLKDATLFVNVPFCIEAPRYAHGRYLMGDGAAKRKYLEAVMREVASLGGRARRQSASWRCASAVEARAL